MQYELNENSILNLSYSRRINRPDADMLNPNPEFTDPRNAEAGNADLLPEQVHSIELGFQTGDDTYSLTNTLYYRYRYDAFTAIQRNVGDTLIIGTIENLNSRQSAGLEVNLSKELNENWDTDLSGDVFYTRLNAANLGYQVRNHGISGNIKSTFIFQNWRKSVTADGCLLLFPKPESAGPPGRIFLYEWRDKGKYLKRQNKSEPYSHRYFSYL